NNVFKEWEEAKIITEVLPEEKSTSNPVYYLPHRPVVRESSLSTKIRPVFDCSVKGYNGISLNDCMEAGPSLFPNIVAILIRFRRWQVGLSSDLTMAFLQLKLNPLDQDVSRFFLDDGTSLRLMKFLRVPFGNRCSPFLLNATIKVHIAKYPPSLARQELDENLYMDDWITGADTDAEGCELINQGNAILQDASMSLAKCASSSPVVSDMLKREFGSRHLDADFIKILGMNWMTSADCFRFDGIDMTSSVRPTKRIVLSFVARLFDPLGFLNPFVTTVKILFQKLWKLHLDWDEQLPEELEREFRTWISGLEVLKSWEIPRCYFRGCIWSNLVA
ncbi:MAG: A17 family peptidase, partial [Candidatus Omnitrophica bacterium]|nr:A17 family peptidase [Candidatus Omnitrophota bacterium]